MYLYIMRHGETDWNKQGLIQGSADIPLNAYGIELAEKTRDGLAAEGIFFDKVFTSPYIRARETAEIIVKDYELPVIAAQNIREMSFGAYEGIKIKELRTNPEYQRINMCFDDPVHYQSEGTAESYEQVFSRLKEFLKDTIFPLESQHQRVLIVCHGAIIRALLSIIKNVPLEDFWRIHQPNCSVNIAKVSQGKITMLEEGRLYYQPLEQPGRRFV